FFRERPRLGSPERLSTTDIHRQHRHFMSTGSQSLGDSHCVSFGAAVHRKVGGADVENFHRVKLGTSESLRQNEDARFSQSILSRVRTVFNQAFQTARSHRNPESARCISQRRDRASDSAPVCSSSCSTEISETERSCSHLTSYNCRYRMRVPGK